MGRFLALCGWLAWQLRQRLPAPVGREAAVALGVVLLIVALAPVVVPNLDPQPEDATVQQIMDGAVVHPDGWVRLTGRVVALREPPTAAGGAAALLVDAANPLRAIVVSGPSALRPTDRTALTGFVQAATIAVTENLPIEATVAGTPPRIDGSQVVVLDAMPKPVRAVPWPLAIPPLILGGVLLIGARVGYPIFRRTFEIDVLARPLAHGERVPAAFGGTVGPNHADLAEPSGALLLVRRDGRGNVLTAQPLPDGDEPAPKAVLIGGGWTSGRIGLVYTAAETVAALHVRSELVDAIFLFARGSERDRVAALVTVER